MLSSTSSSLSTSSPSESFFFFFFFFFSATFFLTCSTFRADCALLRFFVLLLTWEGKRESGERERKRERGREGGRLTLITGVNVRKRGGKEGLTMGLIALVPTPLVRAPGALFGPGEDPLNPAMGEGIGATFLVDIPSASSFHQINPTNGGCLFVWCVDGVCWVVFCCWIQRWNENLMVPAERSSVFLTNIQH